MSLNGCSKHISRGWFRSMPCSRKAKVQRDGKGYCTQHDPVAIAQRRKERDERFNKEWAAKDKQNRYQTAAIRACREAGLSVEALESNVVKDLLEACLSTPYDDQTNKTRAALAKTELP